MSNESGRLFVFSLARLFYLTRKFWQNDFFNSEWDEPNVRISFKTLFGLSVVQRIKQQSVVPFRSFEINAFL